MKLSEKLKETLICLYLLCVLCLMFLGCSERRETPDDVQSKFFNEEIQKRKLNKIY